MRPSKETVRQNTAWRGNYLFIIFARHEDTKATKPQRERPKIPFIWHAFSSTLGTKHIKGGQIVSLTRSELLVAAECAERYPLGHGHDYLWIDPDLVDDINTEQYFIDNPEKVKFG